MQSIISNKSLIKRLCFLYELYHESYKLFLKIKEIFLVSIQSLLFIFKKRNLEKF